MPDIQIYKAFETISILILNGIFPALFDVFIDRINLIHAKPISYVE